MARLKTILGIGILVTIALFFDGCLEEQFIPDPSDPRLPQYTEDGNQVAGALVNDIPWKTNFRTSIDMGWNRSFYFTAYPSYFTANSSGPAAKLTLEGHYTDGDNKDRRLDFIVFLKGISISKLEDISFLNGQSVILDGKANYAIIYDPYWTIENNVDYHYGGTGSITFRNIKKVKSLTIHRQNGERYNPIIVSGLFEFSFENISVAVSSGRFDFYINDSYLDQM